LLHCMFLSCSCDLKVSSWLPWICSAGMRRDRVAVYPDIGPKLGQYSTGYMLPVSRSWIHAYATVLRWAITTRKHEEWLAFSFLSATAPYRGFIKWNLWRLEISALPKTSIIRTIINPETKKDLTSHQLPWKYQCVRTHIYSKDRVPHRRYPHSVSVKHSMPICAWCSGFGIVT
jgi:hypothetical protein